MRTKSFLHILDNFDGNFNSMTIIDRQFTWATLTCNTNQMRFIYGHRLFREVFIPSSTLDLCCVLFYFQSLGLEVACMYGFGFVFCVIAFFFFPCPFNFSLSFLLLLHPFNNNVCSRAFFLLCACSMFMLWKTHRCVPSGSSSNIHTENVTK